VFRSFRTAFCHQLQTLSLVGNPVCSVNAYRQIVASFVPQLSTLDGRILTSNDRTVISEAEVEAAIRAHSESIEAAAVMSLSLSSGSMSRLPLANGDLSSPSQCDPTNFGSLSRSTSVKRIGVAEASTFVCCSAQSTITQCSAESDRMLADPGHGRLWEQSHSRHRHCFCRQRHERITPPSQRERGRVTS